MTTSTASNADELSGLPYAVEIAPEEQPDGSIVFMATHPELPRCMGHGGSLQSAIDALAEARHLYISALLERGLEIPRTNIRRVG
jgi:predicted RNase H-like HicB family nuclease